MTAVVYDAGVLIAAERNDRRVWAEHRVRLEAGILPIVPAPVVTQVSRSSRQVQLRRLLVGSIVSPFTEADAHRAGVLLALSKTSDIVDASVVVAAEKTMADVVTADVGDIKRLVESARLGVAVIEV